MSSQVKIYDTTLRDGNQAKGLNLSVNDKLAIAQWLDDFGIHYIEGGWPNPTNSLDIEFYAQAREVEWKTARICVFGSTRRPGVPVNKDKGLQYLVNSKAHTATIFGKSWDLHVKEILKCTNRENLSMIKESVAFLKDNFKEVIYDAEHFFDGYKENPEYALKTLTVARDGGADCIVLCDTNGGMALPWEVELITARIQKVLKCPVGIHSHNDSGTAVANTLAAVKGGAQHVQGTINGYGERCGNANLITLIPSLQLKMGRKVISTGSLRDLRALSLRVSEIANLAEDIRQPYVGEAAFAHKGGAHIDGVMKVRRSFEHIDPSVVGNRRDFIVSNQSGGSLVLDKIHKIAPGIQKSHPDVKKILDKIKKQEQEGYHFEAADASFQLLVQGSLGMLKEHFKVQSYRVIEEHRDTGSLYSEATVKVKVKGRVEHVAAEGNGPVDAMAKAVRKALRPHYPQLDNVKLQDYKVRVLDDNEGTSSKVRVWVRFHDHGGKEPASWATIGVSTNIVEASWRALMDGINYRLQVLNHLESNT